MKFNKVKFWKRLKLFLRLRLLPKPGDEEIRELIKSLRPLDTGKELIRLGGFRDGGYLVPDDLDEINACFSPGVGGSSNFELDCANLGMQVYLADASVSGPAINDSRFHFIPKFIGGNNRGKYISLDKWISNNDPDRTGDLLLQMDIEGYEYEVLNSLSRENLDRFRVIVVECHSLFRLNFPFYHYRIKQTFKKLLQNHVCVHIHPNNFEPLKNMAGTAVPCAAEFTFLRKDRISKTHPIKKLPHKLDRQNLPAKEPVVLPKFWYAID